MIRYKSSFQPRVQIEKKNEMYHVSKSNKKLFFMKLYFHGFFQQYWHCRPKKYSNMIQFHEVFFGVSFIFSSDSSPKSIVCCSKILVLIMYRTDNHNKKRKTFHHEDINANYKNYFVTVIQPYGKIFLQVHRRHRASMESVLLFRSFEKDFTKKRNFRIVIGFMKKDFSE